MIDATAGRTIRAYRRLRRARRSADRSSGQARAVTVGLVEPVNLYSKVDRSVKYGFLFIGFTFLAFLLFDIVGGARVAAAEYLLTGAGLVLFFVLLLAFAEVIGFTAAYLLASAAIIGLLTAYSAAVLKSWQRARLHRRAAGRALCAAVRAAEPRGVVAADRLGAALRGACRGDVRHAQHRLEQRRPARRGADPA